MIVEDEDDIILNMTGSNIFLDSLFGRASCSRTCYSRNEQYKFHRDNKSIVNCSESQCVDPHPCKYWSYVPNENICILHPKLSPTDKISTDYRRAGSIHGKETYRDYISINAEVGCIDRNDHVEPYIILGKQSVSVSKICSYIPTGKSNLQQEIKAQCYQDYMYRTQHIEKEVQMMDKIEKLLKDSNVEEKTQTQRSKRFAAPLLLNVAMPAVMTWVKNILQAKTRSPQIISPNNNPFIFDELTLDRTKIFKSIIGGLASYHPKLVSSTRQGSGRFSMPRNWNITVKSLDIKMTRSSTQNILKEAVLNNIVQENLAWLLRRKLNIKEIYQMTKVIEKALNQQEPVTEEMMKLLKSNGYVFASFYEKNTMKIHRLFLVTESVKTFPEVQYLSMNMNAQSNLSEGRVTTGRYQSTDMTLLSCSVALSTNQDLGQGCFEKEETINPKYEEFSLFFNQTQALIVRLISSKQTLQVFCPNEAHIAYTRGILIAVMSLGCTLKMHGQTLRIGTAANEENDLVGFKILYNTKLTTQKTLNEKIMFLQKIDDAIKFNISSLNNRITSQKRINGAANEMNGNMTEEIVKTMEVFLKSSTFSSYKYGPYVDIGFTALLCAMSVFIAVKKLYQKCKAPLS